MNIAETDATTSADPSALLQIAAAYWTSQAIYVAAKLGIADILVEGPKSPAQIAQACQAHPDALHRVLRTLASRGIFAEKEDGQFVLTSLAEHLRSDAPSTLRAFILMLGADWHWRSWGELLHSDAATSDDTCPENASGTSGAPAHCSAAAFLDQPCPRNQAHRQEKVHKVKR